MALQVTTQMCTLPTRDYPHLVPTSLEQRVVSRGHTVKHLKWQLLYKCESEGDGRSTENLSLAAVL